MVKDAKRKKITAGPLLPLVGFVLVVSLGIVAYFSSPLAVDLAREQIGPAEFDSRLAQDNIERSMVDNAFAVLVWLVLMATTMMLVAAAIGEDPDKENTLVRPREGASEKEWQKYQKEWAKLEKKRLERAEQVKREQEKREKRR
ncbi:MAG: hypothetical protein ACLFTK_09915 [Anaerolineales bacterium]